ncbi:MAG TPA: alpha/beta hydrolase [Solirubrobacteraceae bacterium]|nr:alpha/beta hydrolase [Solirubrobacteraceae bacterium]
MRRSINANGVTLDLEESGDGPPVVCLHGLTATHRYVLMGSRGLERAGHRVILYDARGHGASSRAPSPADYTYDALAGDLLAVLNSSEIERAVLVGASMGAHTIARFALDQPDRVAGLGLITPAYEPAGLDGRLESWDALADGLAGGGIDGFVAAYDLTGVDDRWRETMTTVMRQRLAAHRDLAAVADALRAVPRSRPFARLDDLAAIRAPTLIVASRDDADPTHPLATARLWAGAIPGSRLVVEEAGRAPLAWQGGQLSRLWVELAAPAGRDEDGSA